MTRHWTAVLCAFATAAFADTLTLRDGRVVDGTYVGGDARTVRMMVGDRVQNFNIDRVVSLTFGEPAPADSGNDQPAPTLPPAPPPAFLRCSGPSLCGSFLHYSMPDDIVYLTLTRRVFSRRIIQTPWRRSNKLRASAGKL